MKQYITETYSSRQSMEDAMNTHFDNEIIVRDVHPCRYVLHSFTEVRDGYTAVYRLTNG